MLLHLFVSGASEGTVRVKPAPLGSKGLVEVCDDKLHSGRDPRGDLGEVHHHVQRRVCSGGGKGMVGTVSHPRETVETSEGLRGIVHIKYII